MPFRTLSPWPQEHRFWKKCGLIEQLSHSMCQQHLLVRKDLIELQQMFEQSLEFHQDGSSGTEQHRLYH